MKIIDNGPTYTNTVDTDNHVTLYRGRKIVFEGSYEAFCAECGVDFEAPPRPVIDAIHDKAERHSAREDARLADPNGAHDPQE